MRKANKQTIQRDGWPETILTLPADRGSHWTVRAGVTGPATLQILLRGAAGDEQLAERSLSPRDGVARIALPVVLAAERLVISAVASRGTTIRIEVGWRAEP